MEPESACSHCGDELDERTKKHIDEHPGLCCSCFDASVGVPLDVVNEKRAARGKTPIASRPQADG